MITLNREHCNDCRECLWVCPNDVFEVVPAPGHGDRLEIRHPGQCFACGHCIAACPQGSLSHPDLPADQFVPLALPAIGPDDLLALMRLRRSIRRFKPDLPPAEAIGSLLAAATEAGSSSNGQTEAFVLIRDIAFLHDLERVVVDVLWNAGFKYLDSRGPMARVLAARLGPEMVGQYRRYHGIFKRRRESGQVAGMIFRNAPLVIAAHGLRTNALAGANCALALRNIELLAMTLGLGTCWVGFLIGAAGRSKRIGQMLGLPPARQVLGALAVGYPAERYTVTMPRKPREVRWAGSGS